MKLPYLLEKIKTHTGLHGLFEAKGLEYSFTSLEVDDQKHIQFVKDLAAIGIHSSTKITTGRGKYNNGRSYAKVTVAEQEPPQRATTVADNILNKFCIDAQVTERPNGLEMAVRNIYSAQTLLRAFSQHHVQVLAVDSGNYRLFVPVAPEMLLA